MAINDKIRVLLVSKSGKGLGWLVFMDMALPGGALAQTKGPGVHQIQPALILALALTSLVLFSVYLFQKSRDKKKDEKIWTSETHPIRIRLHETHKALNSLFSHPTIPMAKTDLEQGRMIDATPALYRPLGYTKKSFLKKSPEILRILPPDESETSRLVEKGWAQFSAPLFHRETGKRINCRILNIITQIHGSPMVLSIVSDMTEYMAQDTNSSEYTKSLS